MPNDTIIPFILAVPQADLEDLNRRIGQTRWPDAETVDDWTQGDQFAKVKALIDHWRHRYDWLQLIITHGWPGFSRALIEAVKVKRKEESHD